GAERISVSLQRSAKARDRLAGESRAGKEAAETSGSPVAHGSETHFCAPAWRAQTDGWVALRQWPALDGVRAIAGQGYRFRAGADHGTRRKGRQRSHHDVAAKFGPTVAATSGVNQSTARARSRRWIPSGALAIRDRAQVPERRT